MKRHHLRIKLLLFSLWSATFLPLRALHADYDKSLDPDGSRPPVVNAAGADDSSPTPETVAVSDDEHPNGRGTPGVAFLAGGAIYFLGGTTIMAPNLAARYYFANRDSEGEGPEALSPWSVEVGGIIPEHGNSTYGGAEDVDAWKNETIISGPNTYQSSVSGVTEFHVAGQYRFTIKRPIRMTPDLSLGVSITRVTNDAFFQVSQNNVLQVGDYGKPSVTSASPLVRLGLPVLTNDFLSLRCEVGYARFGDRFSYHGQSFNHTLSGIGVYPSVQVNLGYLDFGVQRGDPLPSNALPLWALAATQTENKSPIIASPEALLNASQASQTTLSGNVLFQYKNRWVKKVEIVGDFNHWTPEPLYRDKGHVWMTVKDIPPGHYHYNYLVNGKREIRDPLNPQFDLSQRSHGSSIFTVTAEYHGR